MGWQTVNAYEETYGESGTLRREQQKIRAAVRVAIFGALEQLPEPYTKDLYDQECELVYQHVYEVYAGQSRNVR